MYQDKTAMLFVFTAFVAGLCGAFFYPLSSLFIVEELGAEPTKLSLYMFLSVVSSVVVSQLLAAKSDRSWSRKSILLAALFCYLITVVSFTVVRDYWTAVMIATVFGSVSGASFGQLFALGREYADKHVSDSTTFLSTMRAGIAIAWVFGPPLAFILKASFGFNASFMVSAGIVTVGIGVVVLFLPNASSPNHSVKVQGDQASQSTAVQSSHNNGLIALYCLALVAAFSANNLYITSMPLYLSQELQVNPNWLGFLFGAGALCEIPVMLWAGKLAQKLGTIKLMTMAVVSGIVFYCIMLTSTSFIAMLGAQLLNGFFIGVCATLGLVVLQDMMRDRLGTASTLFSSMLSLSMLVSSLSIGIVAQMFNYYSTLYVSLGGSALAVILLMVFSLKTRVDTPLRNTAV